MKNKIPVSSHFRQSILFIAFLFSLTGNAHAQLMGQEGNKLTIPGVSNIFNAQSSSSVALSADGNTAIVGTDQDNGNVGGIRFFTRTGTTWTQQGPKITASDASGAPHQGYSVSISADGNTAVAGGYLDNNPLGAAYVFTRSGGVWTQQGPKLVGTGSATGSIQGWSVAISGDGNTILVGGQGDQSYTGAVWAFTRSAGVWTQQGDKIVGTGALGYSAQGQSVSISYDGNTFISGAKNDNGNTGAAWIFTRSAGTWSQAAKLVGSGNAGQSWQGISVAISGDANTAIIGGYLDNSHIGAAWVFTQSGGVWSQEGTKLVSNDYIGNPQQGNSVSLSYDGNRALVGGWNDNSAIGCVWLYTRSGGVWTQSGSKMKAGDNVGVVKFGSGMAISADGNTAIMNGPYDDGSKGAIWTFSACTSAPPKAAITGASSGVICDGYVLSVADTSTVGKFISSYLWSDGSTTAKSNPITATGTYSVTITNSCGYSSTESYVITTINSSPAPTINSLPYFCTGSTVTLIASDANPTPGTVTYSWSNGSAAAASNPVSTAGTYSVSVTNGVGCTFSMSQTITSNPITVNSTDTSYTSSICYGNLKSAFDAINNGTHTGEIEILVTGNTTETTTCILNESGNGSASYTRISMQPSGGSARTITAALSNAALIELNGADNVLIDGLNTGGNALTISNTSVATSLGTSTIRFINDASNNKITRCSIFGNGGGTLGNPGAGTIVFSTAVTTGNDNDTISYCNIASTNATSMATRHVYGGGTIGMENDGLVIDHNYIGNFFRTNISSAAIDIANGTTGATISNNKIYQSAPRTFVSVNLNHRAINISASAGSGYQVLNNRIGFADTSGTGTYNFNFSGTASSVAAFTGIYLNVGATTPSSVQGNTISNIAVSGNSSGTSTSAPFKGIYVFAGLVNIGNVTGNTIGSMTAAGNITYTSTGTSAADVIGILHNGSNNAVISNNNIGGITVNTNVAQVRNFYGIRSVANAATSLTCNNNTIGGDIANSIRSTTTNVASKMNGILLAGPSGSLTGNTVRNMTAAAGNGASSGAGMIGIVLTGTTDQTVVSNKVYNLSTTASTTGEMHGIYTFTSGINKMERNLVYGLSSTSAAGTVLSGIRIEGGTGTYSNNMIDLGAGVSVFATINGFIETAGTNNFWNNSVYIGGTPVSGSGNSFGLNSAVTGGTREIRNNIFFNARSNSGTATGVQYGISIAGATGLTIDNNLYHATGTGSVFGRFGGADIADLAAWKLAAAQDASSISGDPLFKDPAAATPNLHIDSNQVSIIDAVGVDLGIVVDFDGHARASLTPTDLGADAFIVCLPTGSTHTEVSWFPYTFNDTTYTTTGIYTQTLVNAAGCDSIVTLNLTINQVQIAAVHCGSTIEYLNTGYIAADPVGGAEQYEFRITNGAYTATATDDFVAGKVRMIQFAGYEYNTTYQIEARVKLGGVWTAYGTPCSITTTAYPHSEIEAAQCGTTLSAMDAYIYASTVNGATQYRFRITNGANVQTIDRPTRTFNLTILASYTYSTTYTVDVAVEFNGSWYPYSTSCNITTPALQTTQVVATQCGAGLPTVGTTVNANSVTGATAYRFRVTNGASVQTIDKATPSFKLTELASYSFATTYSVEVAVQYNAAWEPYGSSCNVTTPAAASIPTTQIQASQCGTTLAAISTYFYATSVSGATQYRFRLTENGNVQVLDNATRAINLTMLPVHKANTTYAVEVAVMVNDTWGAYGASCNITSPAVYAKIKAAQCGTTLAKINKVIYADDMSPYATAYRFRVTNGASVQTIDRTTNTFTLTQLASYDYNTTYSIDVAILVNGVWGAYGSACNITTPVQSAARPMGDGIAEDEAASAFEAVVFPNPFANEFGLKVSTPNEGPITVTIYDMTGKVVSAQTVSPQEINSFKAGSELATGLYQIHVVQGKDLEILKVVKQ